MGARDGSGDGGGRLVIDFPEHGVLKYRVLITPIHTILSVFYSNSE